MIASNALSMVDSYVEGVLSGDVVACELVKLAVQRHVDDLKQQSTEGFPYHFDANQAAVAIDFFPLVLRHTIGRFSGLQFVLEPWQAPAIAMLFGWLRDEDNTRRFRTVYWSQGRKNGKSCIGAGLAFKIASADFNPITQGFEQVAEVILCATKREQADKVIYAEMLRMRRKSKALDSRSTAINNQISFSHNDSYIRTVGSDRPYDGLNPQLVVKDEVHAWRECHRTFYDTITTGGGARDQPINLTVTTAGDDKAYIWLEEYNHANGVLRGTIKDETTLAWCFEIDPKDDPFDEANWIKANPNLGVSVSLEYLREQAAKSTTKLSKNRFTRYHANRLTSSTEQAFDMELFDKCEGQLSDWSEADAVGAGIDLGGRDDLAAYAVVARFLVEELEPEEEGDDPLPVWRYEVRCYSYIADDCDRDLVEEPWAEWCYTGKIQKRKYPQSDLRDDLIDDCQNYYVEDVAYDPAGGQTISEEIKQQGIAIYSMSQNCGQFNEPITDMLQAIRDGRFRHDGDPVLRWFASNAVAVRDRMDRWMFDKSKSKEKIDGIVATAMAYRRCMCAPRRTIGNPFISV